MGSENNPAQPNIWLPDPILPDFRTYMTSFFWELDKSAKRILEAIATGLNLSQDERAELMRLHSGHNNQLRLLHYPPIETEKLDKRAISRMPAHQDWSLFTIDFQDSVGELEVQDPRRLGEFVHMKPILNACVLNTGDMMQRFTNSMALLFTSTAHWSDLGPCRLLPIRIAPCRTACGRQQKISNSCKEVNTVFRVP